MSINLIASCVASLLIGAGATAAVMSVNVAVTCPAPVAVQEVPSGTMSFGDMRAPSTQGYKSY